ncbi:hypothetical protein AWB71_05260 [Caballeronia peredens]|nr:hypothetical protein AWB71_05260 [Caballeronia peredens]
MKKAETKEKKLAKLIETIATLRSEGLQVTYQNIGRVEHLKKQDVIPTAHRILSLEGPHKQRAHARYAGDFADVIAGTRIASINISLASHRLADDGATPVVVKRSKTVVREKKPRVQRVRLKIDGETFGAVHKR